MAAASRVTSEKPRSVLAAIVASLQRAGAYNTDAELAPLAVLWPDGAAQWIHVVAKLRSHLPILTLGEYDLETRTGPALWIRAELATRPQTDATPIIYLPGIRKDVFRNLEDALAAIQSLLYLQYRGTMFLQPNGKDWTLASYLQNAQHGLGVRVDGSEATRAALVGSSTVLVDRSVNDLRQHPGGIDAEFLHMLLISDLPRRILDWINDPVSTRGGLDDATWNAFRQELRTRYKLDPDRDGPSEAARMLGGAEAGSYWIDVWNRYAEAPDAYPGIPHMLRGARPGATGQPGLFGSAESNFHWPQDNEDQENALRQALLSLDGEAEAAARQTILDLDQAHAPRRASVWAKLGQSPLALALDHLTTIARMTAAPFPAGGLESMQARFTESGWQVDAAALNAARTVSRGDDRNAVDAALNAIYTPWLWTTAERFQEAMADRKISHRPGSVTLSPGTCVLFADGLRYDLAAHLAELLNRDGYQVSLSGSVGPLPGVTPSAKPAQTPIADLLSGGPKLNVISTDGGATLYQASLKKLLAENGWAFLDSGDTGTPDGVVNGWTELGNIDSYGHNHPHDLPRQAHEEVAAIRNRIGSLLSAGWRGVTVVTDHGWLLTPRPMPKSDLPQHLTVERKGRCARLITGATTHLQTVPWCWDPDVAIAMAPGTSCFEDGKRYEHGGLSLQECIVPMVVATRGAMPTVSARIAEVAWRGLRCQIKIDSGGGDLKVDIRQKAGDVLTSIAARMQAVDDTGTARILVRDDSFEALPAIVVVLDSNERVIAQQATIVGGE